MEQNDLKSIQITVAGRVFPLKISVSEEQVAQDVERELNDKITELQNLYTSRDKLDCVLMTLVTYAFDLKKISEKDNNTITEIHRKVDTLESLLQTIRD
ncbi:MAG: cell division protein ZapA [Saprospiraceae bacterium]|nr:cell division protein ZapA [Saprospiraceae bacterium]